MAIILLIFVVNLTNSPLLALVHASIRKTLSNFSKFTVLLFKTRIKRKIIYSSSSKPFNSSHITLMMPKALASNTPNNQAKYHILFSFKAELIQAVTIFTNTFYSMLAPHHFITPNGIAQNNWYKQHRSPEHNV